MSASPLRAFSLAVRGIWWRRWSSLAILLVGIACTGVAAASALFATSARDAVFRSNLGMAPADTLGSGVSVSLPLDGTVSRALLTENTVAAFGPLLSAGYVNPAVAAESSDVNAFDASKQRVVAAFAAVYRELSCAHVVILSGRCVDEDDPHGVVITQETATSRHWLVGTPVVIGSGDLQTTMQVRGIYEPLDPANGYWFARSHNYFGQVAAFAKASVPRGDAVLVSASFWDKVLPLRANGNVSAAVDFALSPAHVRLSSVDRLQALYATAAQRAQTPLRANASPPSVVTTLPSVLTRSVAAVDSVGAPIYVVGVELLVLTWLVLYVLLVSSAEARTSEIVLGKVRGLSPTETALHAVLEPMLLVLAAVPAGVGAAALAFRGLGRAVFGSSFALSVPASAWLAAGVAGLGGVVAIGLASVAGLRRSVLDQWRRTLRRPGRAGWLVEAIVVTLAVAAVIELITAPTALSSRSRFLPISAPALLAIAGAIVGVRLLPLLARSGFRATRGSSHVALFIALRQIGRRAGDLRVFILVTVAVAQLVFGWASRSVLTSNQSQRALTQVGAAQVLSVAAAGDVDPSAVLARLDPSGRWSTAVYAGGLNPGSADDPERTPSLLVVDPATFGSVGYWRRDFGSSNRLADQLKPLAAAPPQLVDVQTTSVTLTARVHVESDSPVQLHLGLTDRTGAEVDAVLATIDPLPRGTAPQSLQVTAAIPECAGGCLFRRLSLLQTGFLNSPPKATIAITSIDVATANGPREILPTLSATSWTSPDTNRDGAASLTVTHSAEALSFTLDPAFGPLNRQRGYEIVSNVPTAAPALVTTAWTNSQQRPLTVEVASGLPLKVSPTLVTVLPRLTNQGVLLSRAWLPAIRPDGYATYRANQVWLNSAAPADFAARLTAAGLSIRATQVAATRAKELAAQGADYAVDMLVFGAGAAGVLAVVGAATSLLIAARRRLYEMAAVRSLGARRTTVVVSLVVEHGAVCAAAALLGLVAGLVGARIALAKLPEFADDTGIPRFLLDVPVLPGVALAALVGVVIALGVAIGGLALVRQASPSRLREAQQ